MWSVHDINIKIKEFVAVYICVEQESDTHDIFVDKHVPGYYVEVKGR